MITEKITYFCTECDFSCYGISEKEKHEAKTNHTIRKHIEIIKHPW